MDYIKKVDETKLWNQGSVALWDYSRANQNEESRIEAISAIASICYGKPPKDAGKLVERLWTESGGLPSSAFEFIRWGSTDWSSSINASLRNDRELKTFEEIAQHELDRKDAHISRQIARHNKRIATFRIKIPIFVARQIERHRSFSFQELCISGDSKISTAKGLRTIKSLYEQQYKSGTDGRKSAIRVFDFGTQRFTLVKDYTVTASGQKTVKELTVQASKRRKKIRVTGDHLFMTKEGWKKLDDLNPGDFIAINGEPIWRNKEFLSIKKAEFLLQGIGMKGMALELGINYNTLKKWMHKFGLQYTPKEAASTFTVWNKGARGADSHSYGVIASKETRQRISNALVKDYRETSTGFRSRVASYWEADFRRREIFACYNYQCAVCGAAEELEIDHIKPVSLYPEKAFDPENVQVLCADCHQQKTNQDQSLARLTARYVMVESITEKGKEETFDIAVNHKDHNFIANGFIVHNSRRYTTGESAPLEFWCPTQTYWQASMGARMSYEALLREGEPPERARAVLGTGLYTEIWLQSDAPGLKNYFAVRLDKHAQKEHQELAQAMLDLLEKHQHELWNEVKPNTDEGFEIKEE